MDEIILPTQDVEEQDLSLYYASFRSRVYATAIDMTILLPIIYLLKAYFAPVDNKFIQDSLMQLRNREITFSEYIHKVYIDTGGFTFDLISQIILLALLVYLLKKYGHTPGKWLMKLRVVDSTTLEKPTRMQAFIRSISYIVSMLPLFAGFFAIAFNKKHQAFHDRIAHTLVLYTIPHDAAWKAKEFKRNTVIGLVLLALFALFSLLRSQHIL